MQLQLIGDFTAADEDGPVSIPPSGARLLALLALEPYGLPRACAAGTLWPDKSEERATANLRSALWRLKHSRPNSLMEAEPGVLTLGGDVDVDLDDIGVMDRAEVLEVNAARRLLLDLLEGWDDPWITPHRIRWRQTRLHMLDDLCRSLIRAARYEEAVELARLVLRAEPLRESVVRILVEAEVHRCRPEAAAAMIDRYRALLAEQAGAHPSAQLARWSAKLDSGPQRPIRVVNRRAALVGWGGWAD